MKKLIIIVILLSTINLILLVLTYCNIRFSEDDFTLFYKYDTVVNRIRIDSIEYVIRSKDSVINKIKYNENKYIEKANSLNDDDAVKLFKQLVSE